MPVDLFLVPSHRRPYPSRRTTVRTTKLPLIVLAGLLAGAACSDVPQGRVSTDSARSSVDQLGRISKGLSSNNVDEVTEGVMRLLTDSPGIVSPATDGEPTFGVARYVGPESFQGDASCGATGCTFGGYAADIPLTGTYVLDGTITRDEPSITFDVDYDQVGKNGSALWSLGGAVSITADRIDGDVHVRGGARAGAYTSVLASWDVTLELREISIDGGGCPIGGSLHAVVHYEDDPAAQSTAPRSPSFDVQGTATFGPACGAVN
jgi:hypothetical protein